MRSSMVLTVIGPDRPGIVELLAQTIAAHGGNWEQSRMAHLCGQFAGILNLSLDEVRLPELHAALAGLRAQGLRVVSETTPGHSAPPFRGLRLELTGTDREGIVRDIARALAARDVNVEELDTRRDSAPMSGDALFHATALLRLPPDVAVDQLRKLLESIADDLMVDLTLEALPEDSRR
jgi:glycine cleavage system regulatory protein